ncbi:MAG: hypothetical protein A2Y54_00900 [Chloroflexi bacterium RBG_16_51_16]|nr:MAG: hypothetical protein A2Y54_00900 [Chloroflexi bacterium RBG_16_51_16]
MSLSASNLQKPVLLTIVAVSTLTSGIVNLFWGFIMSATAFGTILGIVCLPLTVLPMVLGIVEIVHAARLLSAQPQPVQPSTAIAVLEVVCILFGNVFSMIVGILALVFYNDLTVKDYFIRLNGSQPHTENTRSTTPSTELPVQSNPEGMIPLPGEINIQEMKEKIKPPAPRKVARK